MYFKDFSHPWGGSDNSQPRDSDALWLGTGKVTVGLASHWPCVRLCGLSTYRLNQARREGGGERGQVFPGPMTFGDPAVAQKY